MLSVEENQHGADEGENYFVSMTDMMVGVLFIFLIMLMIFALDFRSRSDDQSEALKAARNAAEQIDNLSEEVRRQVQNIDEAAEERRKLLTEIKDRLRSEDIIVEVSQNSDVLRITRNAVRFRHNSAELEGISLENVSTIAQVLNEVLPDYVACRTIGEQTSCTGGNVPKIESVFVEGHTDDTGGEEANWRFSTERATVTLQQLLRSAPALRTLRNSQDQGIFSASGYADSRPIDPADRTANRRIDLRFVMESDSHDRMQRLASQAQDLRDEVNKLIQVLGGR